MAISMTEEQLQRIIAALAPASRQGSFARCNAVYDGTGDNETVETFLSAIKVYKKIENIDDENALEGLTLLLKGDAAVWWEGAKSDVKSWTDFEDRLRHAFAPKIPADILYQRIIELKQDAKTPTEKFVAKKRALIAQLPAPIPPETHQLHMIYGQLHLNIREMVPRSAFKSIDELLKLARSAEEILLEKKTSWEENVASVPSNNERNTSGRQRCEYCDKNGHAEADCRTKKRQQQDMSSTAGEM
ncbi:activity-regulated cytoskeleton associated protein 2-like [Leguminivora glycinivorella]|uniref:activity-regulated cytoskeleton associated protein 2-like n=1 Tax=Leguminivora glycinivorella TaxID=1035111 RepID=UPI00200BA6F7|nr:activity-regulated cytoskeleton associated protein 2-like [Leguminivora glycinivorella]